MADSASGYWGPRAHQRRAVKLLQAGLLGGHVTGLLTALAWWVAAGAQAGAFALLGMAAVLLFFALGQAIQVIYAGADPRLLMGIVLVGYGIRVLGIFALLGGLAAWAPVPLHQHRLALCSAMVLAVTGWVAAEIFVFQRIKIPLYDVEYLPPSGDSEEM